MPRQQLYRRLLWPGALCLVATALALPSVMTSFDRGGLFRGAESFLTDISATLAWLSAAWFGARLFRLVVSHGERPMPRLLGDMVAIILFIAAAIVVLSRVYHQPVEALVTTSSVLVAVLGFSLRELIVDIFSGVCINMEQSYSLGDWLELPPNSQVGKVVEINWRATRMVTLDGITIVVPNGMIAKSRFLNYSMPQRFFRVVLPVIIEFDAPVDRVRRLLLAAVQGSSRTLLTPAPVIQIEGFYDHGLRYNVMFWVSDYDAMAPTRTQVIANIHRHLRLGGVALYHARQDLTVARAPTAALDLDARRVAVLRHVALFRALSDEDLEQLAEEMTVRHEPPGSVVVSAGDSGNSLFVVVEGLLEVRSGDDVLAILGPGEVFGEMSLLTGAPRSATVVAANEAILFEIFDQQLRPILHSRPDLAGALGAIVDQRRRANRKRIDPDQETTSAAGGEPLLVRIRSFFGLNH